MLHRLFFSFSRSLLMTILIMAFIPIGYYYNFAEAKVVASKSIKSPIIADHHLKVELVLRGLKSPTSMAFLGPNDILVLEKNNGTVQRIVNGKLSHQPLLNVSVANEGERGMLGIAIAKNSAQNATYVFLYYTLSGGGKTGDDGYSAIQPS